MGLLCLACGKKGTPLPRDRFAPALDDLRVVDQHHIRLAFSEEIDTLVLAAADFEITDARLETLGILAVHPYFNNSEVVLTTATQDTVFYSLLGIVKDVSGNACEIEETFQGSRARDSLSPYLLDYPAKLRSHRLFLKFSETMDTASIRYAFTPKGARKFRTVWDKGLQRADFVPLAESDSFPRDTVFYCFLDQARDLAGNVAPRFVFHFTTDTVLPSISIEGSVRRADSLITGALVVVRRHDHFVALALSEAGRFKIPVRQDTVYELTAFYGGLKAAAAGMTDRSTVLHLVEDEAPGYEDLFK